MIEIKGEAGFVKIVVGAETVDIELFVGDGDDGYDSCMLYDIDKTEFIEALKKIKEYKPTKSIKKKVREG